VRAALQTGSGCGQACRHACKYPMSESGPWLRSPDGSFRTSSDIVELLPEMLLREREHRIRRDVIVAYDVMVSRQWYRVSSHVECKATCPPLSFELCC
jgi:hypothetical protein